MASAKRKQDEKNLKILRELVSQPGNKECFDCRQRGPTYVNMTIGSFICTSCSGILRGLTPPHRVKSISMATFTQDEIEHIKERGNDHCRRIWLGLADPPTLKILDSKDEQKIKDLMIAKYEAKRYYLDPAVQTQSRNVKTPANNVKSNQTIIPRVPLLGTTAVSSPTQRIRNSDTTNVNTNTFNAEFVADFSKVQDSFSTTTPALTFNQAFPPQPSFANFDNNPIFNSPKSTDSSFSNDTTGSFAKFNGTNNPPPEDRYAALKDLDSLMKQTQIKEEPAIAPVSAWDLNNSAGTNAVWGSNNQTTNVISNPFTVSDVWQPVTNFANNNNNNSQLMDNTCNSANPFRTMQFSTNNEHQWLGVGSPANGKIVTSSQMTTPFSNKAWQPTVTSYHANPFMVGSGVATTTRNTNNPFL